MTILLLVLVSSIAWFISSLVGGGSPFIIIPLVSSFLEVPAIPPVITIGMLLGNSQRAFIFWQDIDWWLTWWYLPGAIIGAILGAFVFTQTEVQWLQVLIGLFLVSSVPIYSFQGQEQSCKVHGWFFLPAGFVYAFLSGLIGSMGPILNPFYLNYGLVKEKMIATKSVHVLIVHVAKLVTYAAFGVVTLPYVGYGLVIGIAAVPGNWLGQIALRKISDAQFRQLVFALVSISGFLILWEQRDFFCF
jgi:uncharacterized membrane protein YfcA